MCLKNNEIISKILFSRLSISQAIYIIRNLYFTTNFHPQRPCGSFFKQINLHSTPTPEDKGTKRSCLKLSKTFRKLSSAYISAHRKFYILFYERKVLYFTIMVKFFPHSEGAHDFFESKKIFKKK